MQLGIIVAKAIIAGDVSRARAEAAERTSWSVSEARAISAACRVARERFAGCSVSFEEFCGMKRKITERVRRTRSESVAFLGRQRLADLRAHMTVCRAKYCKICR